MFREYIFNKVYGNQANKIIIVDEDNIREKYQYKDVFVEQRYLFIEYKDDLSFRIEYDSLIKEESAKLVVVVDSKQYIPYDVLKRFTVTNISYEKLFSRINTEVLKDLDPDLDLLSIAYDDLYNNILSAKETESFIKKTVYGVENIKRCCDIYNKELRNLVETAADYKDWYRIAEIKAMIDVRCAQYRLPEMTQYVNDGFKSFVLNDYGKLSSVLDSNGPVLVSKAMEYMRSHSEKFAIIVMDGMSEFDWAILSESFKGVPYERTGVHAMIPTVTSISRQCLLSNKYPSQLLSPWNQSKEKAEFVECAKSLGYSDNQIAYERGYEIELSSFVKCAAVIINDIDDLVHGQHQGREGMYNDISYLAQTNKLINLCNKLLSSGYDVYISSDHGNTYCTGLGRLTKTGVETETRSHRMLVLNDFADKETIMNRYGMIEFPKYYLDKDFDYLVCDTGTSLDNTDEKVMSHGGISIEEVIVPFIKMKAR
ncbi:MAG: PglZ domain-containing protein [Erysipelotrichaceae bacterium]|nr:PglZ domain-containing protein [Erysipelotrichaceae bacterium]